MLLLLGWERKRGHWRVNQCCFGGRIPGGVREERRPEQRSDHRLARLRIQVPRRTCLDPLFCVERSEAIISGA